ncbi:MAG: aminopeptidase P family protein [Acetobacteraceae bacterium]|nr:aminopeptidase P family protein [Acetobacteraceae bacterium]
MPATPDRTTLAGRLAALRAELAGRGLDGFIVPRADSYLNEYVPPDAERLAWLTGFTGSAGAAVVLAGRAAIFIDGRYVEQAAAETDPALWERCHLIEAPPAQWLRASLRPGQKFGIDPWLHGSEARSRLEAAIREAGAAPVLLESNPLDAVWHDRPPPPAGPALAHAERFAGKSSAAKRAEIAAQLGEARQDAAIVSATDSVAWLLNIRGRDVDFNPIVLASSIVHADGRVDLFTAPGKIPPALAAHLGNAVSVHAPDALAGAVAALCGRRVRLDPERSASWYDDALKAAGAIVVPGMDPCVLAKARKNVVEIAGMRAAHLRDGVAMCRFLAWLDRTAAGGGQTELSAAARLLALRAEGEHFVGESFPAISAAGPHGAIIHYRPAPTTDRPIVAGETYLIDCGAQYLDGTTDITRTVLIGAAPPDLAELRGRATRVLKGHIAIATLRFPQGVAGPHIDAFARRALWEVGLDYDHGTGHGVGAYLNVHEGPCGISRAAKPIPLASGMVLSNEPGFYLPGRYGIRLENLELVVEREGATKPFLGFEALTLAPFDRRLIDPLLLGDAERGWLDAYHARVLAEIGPHLAADEAAWLAAACAPVS